MFFVHEVSSLVLHLADLFIGKNLAVAHFYTPTYIICYDITCFVPSYVLICTELVYS